MSTVSGRSGAFEPVRPGACIRPVRDPGCNTTRPFPAAGPVGRMGRCEKEPAVILMLDQAQADLGGSELRCPDCSGQLRRWGFAPHRAYTIDVVGQALLASALGRSHRTIGADLGVPADTVRDWIRRVRARAQWLRVQGTRAAHRLDPMLAAIVPAGSALADAMSVLATAAAAMVRRRGPFSPPWQII